GNKQPLDRDKTFTTLDEGTAKTTLHPEGSRGDKYSWGNKPPAGMEPQNPIDADFLGNGAKYQEDQTQCSRLRYQSLTENEGEPSYEGDSDTQPMLLTYADEDKHTSSDAPHTEASDTDSSSDKILRKITEDQWEKHKEAAVHYVNLKASIDDYCNENIAHKDQIDQLVKAFMSSLKKSSSTINDLYKGLEAEDPRKLIKASSIVRPDPDEPVIKVVREEAKKLGIHPKETITTKAGELLKKAQEAEHEVLKRQRTEKVRKSLELRKHKYDSYMWTVSNKLKPKPITDIKIHPKTKPVVITVYRGTNGRNFDVYKLFLFGAFGISELDELREIIPKKKNTVVKDLMNSLSRRYEMLRQILRELEIQFALPAPKPYLKPQDKNKSTWNLSLKQESLDWNAIELSLKMSRSWSDVDKVGMEALVSYLVAASMVKSPENARFSMKLRKLITEHPDQEKLKSKKVKLEALGYNMD
nr:hypothetical protein [Tanacetum cinerariifolium]